MLFFKCDENGFYENKQCDDSGYCWCVHKQDRSEQLFGEGLDSYVTCDGNVHTGDVG